MKVLSITTALLAALLFVGIAVNYAEADPEVGNGPGVNDNCPNFVDEDGDGINDNCLNDGVRPQDGSGAKKRSGFSRSRDPEAPKGNGDVSRDQKRTRDPDNCGGKSQRNIRRGRR